MWRFPRLVYPLPRPARSVSVVRNVDYAGDGQRRHRLDIIRRRARRPQGRRSSSTSTAARGSSGTSASRGSPSSTSSPVVAGWVSPSTTGSARRATWPEHIVDCKRAIAWVRAHIAEYGGDPSFIAVSGGSGGWAPGGAAGPHARGSGFPAGLRGHRHLRRRLRAPLRRIRHDGAARHLHLRRRLLAPAREARVQVSSRGRPGALRGGLAAAAGAQRRPTVLRDPRTQRHPRPGGRGPDLRFGSARLSPGRPRCTPSCPTPSMRSTCCLRSAAHTPWPLWSGSSRRPVTTPRPGPHSHRAPPGRRPPGRGSSPGDDDGRARARPPAHARHLTYHH